MERQNTSTELIMQEYLQIIESAYVGYGRYLWFEITHPSWHNYFYWLVGLSVVVYSLELIKPWRENQPKFRKDFWLDAFYMFFNFFLFSLIIYNAASDVFVNLFNDFLAVIGIENTVAIHIEGWPYAAQLAVMFVARDFIQWWVHRLLHRVPFLWEFHKVHHSVEQMGFAAHLRFHWMETIVYRFIEYLPLAMIGFGLDDFFIVHIIALGIGHWNHANFTVNIGPLKYIFNNPAMHIWHHAHDMPESHPYGINFGLSLSVWDYIFGTAHIPSDGKNIKLGFPGVSKFPKTFFTQVYYGLTKSRS